MSAHRYRLSFDYARDAAGAVLGSAKLVFSTSGGAVPLSVYTDAGLTASATTITADSAGLFGDIFLGNGGPYRVELWNNGLTTMYWREDPVYRDRVRLYLSALPSVNWPGMEVVLTSTNHLNVRNAADTAWIDQGDVDSLINAASVTEVLTGTETAKSVTPDSLAAIWQRGTNITPSAGSVALPSTGGGVFNIAAGNFSAISTAQGGRAVLFVFGGASTITYNATSMILPTSANITTVAGDCGLFVNEAAADASGSNWRCVWFQRRSGSDLAITDFVATQANQETGSSTTTIVTPGRQHFHPSACKCWAYVSVSGGVPTLDASYNITSIADTNVGRMTITIATDFSSALWSYACSSEQASAGTELFTNIRTGTLAAGTIELNTTNQAGTDADPGSYGFQGFGDLA